MGIDPTVAHPSGEDTNHLGVFLTQRSDVSAKRRVSVWMHVHGISLKLPVKICPTSSPLPSPFPEVTTTGTPCLRWKALSTGHSYLFLRTKRNSLLQNGCCRRCALCGTTTTRATGVDVSTCILHTSRCMLPLKDTVKNFLYWMVLFFSPQDSAERNRRLSVVILYWRTSGVRRHPR